MIEPKRIKPVVMNEAVVLPVNDMGYEQMREFSQFRNGEHVIYKALHALNLYGKCPVSAKDVYALLSSAPKSRGKASFLKYSTVRRYLHANSYGLWRKVDQMYRSGKGGQQAALYVASGLTNNGRKVKKVK